MGRIKNMMASQISNPVRNKFLSGANEVKFSLKKFLFILLISQLVFFAAKAEAGKIYAIPVNYEKGKISFGEIITKLGYVPSDNSLAQNSGQKYLIELVSFGGKVLESKNFSFSLIIMPAPPLPGEKKIIDLPAILDKTSQLIVFPYHKDGRILNIYGSNKKLIISKDIAYLSEMCGDGICQAHESYGDCVKDCPPAGQDDYCNLEEAKIDPDCRKIVAYNIAEDKKVQAKSVLAGKAVYFILFIILLIGGAVYLIYRKRRKNAPR